MGIKESIIVIAVFFSMVFAVSAVDATVVKVETPSQPVGPGENFIVNVTVEGVTNMGADQATLNFDPSVMSVTGVTEGDFLKTGGATVGAGMEIIDNVNGKGTFFYALTTPGIGVTGSGTLATIYFDTNASAEGMFNLNLTDVLLADGDGTEISVDAINGTITVGGPSLSPTPTPTPTTGGNGGNGDRGEVPRKTPEPTPTPTPVPTLTSTPSPKEEEKTYENVTSGEEVTVEILDKELTITFKKNISGVKITAKELVEKPVDVPEAPGIVFKYLEYNIENVSPEDIEKITIPFDVPKSWIASENIDPATIKLSRYYNGVWNPLLTEKVGEDEEYIHYSAESKGLLIFAITGEKKTEAPVTTPSSAILVWGVLGVVLLIVVIVIGVWYIKKRRQ